MGLLLLTGLLFLAIGPCLSKDITEIEHIVVFMQENRAYDHYFGTLNGVRGFNDRTAITLPNGKPAWYQPVDVTNSSKYMLPFHVDTLTTSAICMGAPTMDYPHDIGIWNEGRYDAWNTARDPGFGMSYFERSDLPFYYALNDEFTVGDQYFQSTYTQTNPNRLHLFSGSNGLSVGQDPVLDNTEPVPGWSWETVAETLEAANVTWKLYQEQDNFDDNGFSWFANFQNSVPGDPLYDKGQASVDDIVEAFGTDVKNNNLPQVSWIVGPAHLSEHATYHPAAGEDLTARLLIALQANKDVYAKTAFILNYDEGGQFFDHHWSPNVPTNGNGKSTVSTKGEVTSENKPIGPGFRVPLTIISPWTRGHTVVSEVFDHTSVIQFIEKRFKVHHPTISAWRRAMMGDLTSAFDFDNPDYSWPSLPDTSKYVENADKECADLPAPTVPKIQSLPKQEQGTRTARPLPYRFAVNAQINSTSLALTIDNTHSTNGAPFIFYDILNLKTVAPRYYSVEMGKVLSDEISLSSNSKYNFTLHGPNGFVRTFAGDTSIYTNSTALPSATVSYDISNPRSAAIVVEMNNTGASSDRKFIITSNAYYERGPWTFTLGSKLPHYRWTYNVASSGNWYDFTISIDEFGGFSQRIMGRIETGLPTISDPAMAQTWQDTSSIDLYNFDEPTQHPVLGYFPAYSQESWLDVCETRPFEK